MPEVVLKDISVRFCTVTAAEVVNLTIREVE